MRRTSTAFKLLSWFCDNPGAENAKTPYDLALTIGVHPGTAIYQRISCDLRGTLGLDIPCLEPRPNTDDLHTYYLPLHQLEAARKIRDSILGPPTAPSAELRKVPSSQSSASDVSPSASDAHLMYCMTPMGLVATDGVAQWIVDGTESEES